MTVKKLGPSVVLILFIVLIILSKIGGFRNTKNFVILEIEKCVFLCHGYGFRLPNSDIF